MKRTRQGPLALLLTGILLLCSLADWPAPTVQSFRSAILPNLLRLRPPVDHDLSYLFRGEWRFSTDLDADDLEQTFGATEGCFPVSTSHPSPAELDSRNRLYDTDEGWARAVEVAAWVWTPASGRSIREWSDEAFVERMLQSRVGLYISGDSLSEHHFKELSKRLATQRPPTQPGVPAPPPLAILRHLVDISISELTLNPDHPLFHRLSRPGSSRIPIDRLSKPFAFFTRCEYLLSWQLVQTISTASHGLKNWTIARDQDLMTQLGQTIGYDLNGAVETGRLEPTREDDGWPGERDGFLLLNTGPHWNRYFMKAESNEQIGAIYSDVTERVLRVTELLPKIKTIYRATTPAHLGCATQLVPASPVDLSAARLARSNGSNPDWGWAQFEDFNHQWSSRILNKSYDGFWSESGRAGYLDVWDLSDMRPDGHHLSRDGWSDCLHWCAPGMHWTWTRLLWHLID